MPISDLIKIMAEHVQKNEPKEHRGLKVVSDKTPAVVKKLDENLTL